MKRYGLIGKTLKHSFSKDYFTKKFAATGLADCAYDNFELSSIDELQSLLANHPEIKGLNITIPYKEAVIPYLHGTNEVVAAIKACNCIKIEQGKLYGYNTDVVGFKQSLVKQLQPFHNRALLLGTGGAAKAVQYVLESLGISYQIVSRTARQGVITYDDINEDMLREHPLIINSTPSGMYPHMDEAPAIPYQYITPHHFLFDLIYNPAVTRFLHEGQMRGATICNGYEMLVLQAEESWRIWNS